jgi:hypothetical protein
VLIDRISIVVESMFSSEIESQQALRACGHLMDV